MPVPCECQSMTHTYTLPPCSSQQQVKYSRTADSDSVRAKIDNLRVSFKNTRETLAAIRGLTLKKARTYLNNVIQKKDIVPFRRYRYGVSRNSQCKKHGANVGRWPVKVCKNILALLRNAESNAKAKNIGPNSLKISHIQVNQAPKMRRRMYRAHGRINKYESSPSHVQLILSPIRSKVAAGKGKKHTPTKAPLQNGATAGTV